MKKILVIMMLFSFVFLLSGCNYIQEDNFVYYDGYNDSEVKYFDEYAIVYYNDDYNLTLYAVRDETIIDTSGEQYINYLLEWDISKITMLSLTCGNHSLQSGGRSWDSGGIDSHLVPGEEVADYCGLYSDFELTLPNEEKILIDKFNSNNASDLDWQAVSDIDGNNLSVFFRDNTDAIIGVAIAILVTIILSVIYMYLYKRNYNNYIKGLKVRKLPNFGVVNIILIVILFVTSVIIIIGCESLENRFESNFYDYVQQEDSTYYLHEFVNDGYELIGSDGNQEVYINIESDDDMTFFFVLVDNDIRYYMDAFSYSFPNAAVHDLIRVDLYQKEDEFGGLIFGFVVAWCEIIEGESTQVGALSLGVTSIIDGETVFIDYLDSTNSWEVYYENSKGYYKTSYFISELPIEE